MRHKKTQRKPRTRHNTTIAKTKPLVIAGMVFAVWCGHCKALEPEWKKLKNMLKSDRRVKLEQVEQSQENTKLVRLNNQYLSHSPQKIVANGYPTIFKIVDGKVEYYDGQRDAVKMFNWITETFRKGGEGETENAIPVEATPNNNTEHLNTHTGGKHRTLRRRVGHNTTRKWFGSKWLSLW
jgi:thiol-disulfide isomerase/thioredoxin